MFDIGFPELLLISVVALVVIGPEKLPETVRTVALWIGRFKRSLSNIRMELENEIGADEIRQQLHNESIMKELSDTKSELEDIIQNADNSITEAKNSLKAMPTELSDHPVDNPTDAIFEDPAGLPTTGIENPTELEAIQPRFSEQEKDAAPKLTGNSK